MTIDDIPQQYHGHETEVGPRYHRFAAGLQAALETVHGDSGLEAGHRLVQSGFHLRYSGVGLRLHELAESLSGTFAEHDQFVYLSGFQLTVVSAAAAIDLGAATLIYLAGGAQREPSLREVTANTALVTSLTEAQKRWVDETGDSGTVQRLIHVRNALVHGHVPLNVRIGGTPMYTVIVDGQEEVVDPQQAYDLAVDRFIALGLALDSDLP